MSVWEIFGFAMHGFSLHILPPCDHYRMGATLDAIEKGQVTDLHFVPTVFGSFLEYLKEHPEERGKLRSLKNVFLSGEALHASLINDFAALPPEEIRLHNLYGPAECAVDVTFYDCARSETDPVPIGRPVANTRIYVLDKDLQPVPVGVTGQICIAGANVGKGYLGDPERTAEKFIDDPFGEGKMYLTGDLGYWREDGQLIFVGRNDDQVKLHGQRIELGEIEAALSKIEGVTNACVLLKNDPDRLTAFYTGTADETAVSATLARVLPAYMRPSALLRMETMPTNASGKTDRQALADVPLPELRERSCEPPESETEKAVCEAFSEVLGAHTVGRNDSFHDLGGTSLQLIKLLSRPPLEKLTPEDFLSDPTPAGLAKKLDGTEKTSYTYLVQLYHPRTATKALVLFSFAGGNASAFTALAAVFRREKSDIALYYMPWLKDDDFPAAAEEIRKLSSFQPVGFYSHCAGAVTAMRLLDMLNRDRPVISSWTAGGNIPPKPGKRAVNVWKAMPDDAIFRFLTYAGLPKDGISQEQKHTLIMRFRRDTAQFYAYAKKKKKHTPICVHLVLSKNDPFTRNYPQASEHWNCYTSSVKRVSYIRSESHYFQSKEADLLFGILSDYLKEG